MKHTRPIKKKKKIRKSSLKQKFASAETLWGNKFEFLPGGSAYDICERGIFFLLSILFCALFLFFFSACHNYAALSMLDVQDFPLCWRRGEGDPDTLFLSRKGGTFS